MPQSLRPPVPPTRRRRSRGSWAPVLALAFALTPGLAASQPPAAGAPPAMRVDDLGWMAGAWRLEEAPGRSNEETWMPPHGGAMLGVHRDVRDGRLVGFEFLRISEDAGVVTYWASPGGAAPTPFRLVELGSRRAVFANPDHDFPQRITYWRDDTGLHARIEGPQGERTVGMGWSWQPVPCQP
jgi:hypothetical protein